MISQDGCVMMLAAPVWCPAVHVSHSAADCSPASHLAPLPTSLLDPTSGSLMSQLSTGIAVIVDEKFRFIQQGPTQKKCLATS